MNEAIENKESYYKSHPNHVLNKKEYYLKNRDKILEKSREKYKNTVRPKPLSKKIVAPKNIKVEEMSKEVDEMNDIVTVQINRTQLIEFCQKIKNLPISIFEFITKCLNKSFKNPEYDLNKFYVRQTNLSEKI
jgi:hypothetical protein